MRLFDLITILASLSPYLSLSLSLLLSLSLSAYLSSSFSSSLHLSVYHSFSLCLSISSLPSLSLPRRQIHQLMALRGILPPFIGQSLSHILPEYSNCIHNADTFFVNGLNKGKEEILQELITRIRLHLNVRLEGINVLSIRIKYDMTCLTVIKKSFNYFVQLFCFDPFF